MGHYQQSSCCLLILAFLAMHQCWSQAIEQSLADTARLPNTSFPLNYTLNLTTNIHRGELLYKGNCSISIKVYETTDQLVMHAKNLTIENAFMINFKSDEMEEQLNFTTLHDFLILKRTNSKDKNFEKGEILRVDIQFTGTVNNEEEIGFRSMEYTNQNGQETTFAFTLFQPDQARYLFPCYDEPALKAKYTLRITHGFNLKAISNTPQDGDVIPDPSNRTDMVTTSFKQTELMSVYLLAFFLSDFPVIEQTSRGLTKRIFTLYPIENDTANIFSDIDWGFETMQDLFDITYTFSKLDMVIFDLPDGGMENWGLIYYNFGNTTCFADQCFIDPTENMYLTFHEFVHQWFGNLVTTEWWTHLWLNEGFATYYGYVFTDLRIPKDRALDRFKANFCMLQLMRATEGAMTEYTEENLAEAFGEIAYNKAACVVQMFEHAFQQKVFRQGVSKYLKTNLYSIVTEDDLFNALQYELLEHHNSTSQPWNYSVHAIMKSWTHNKFFPTITVTRDYTEANSSKIKIQQNSVSGEKFWIPLTFATKSNPDFKSTQANYFLRPTVAEVEIDLSSLNLTLKPDDWLIVNKNANGYYIVKYDEKNLELLINNLKKDRHSISPLNRASLYANIADVELQWSGFKSIKNLTLLDLELIDSLKKEDDPIVWLAAIRRIRFLPIYQKHSFELLRSYLREIIEPQYEHFQKRSDSLNPLQTLLFKELQALAREFNFKTSLNDKNLTNAYLQTILINNYTEGGQTAQNWNSQICRAVKNITDEDFDILLGHHTVYEDDCRKWVGLQCSRSEEQVLKYFQTYDEVWESTECLCQFINFISFLQVDNVDTWDLAWNKINENFKTFMLENDANCISNMLTFFKHGFSNFSPKNLEKFQNGFKDFAVLNDFYKERKNAGTSDDKISKWLSDALNKFNQSK